MNTKIITSTIRPELATGFCKLGKRIDVFGFNLGKKIDLLAGDVSWLKRSVGKLMKKAGV